MSRVNKYRGIHIHVHPQNKHLNRRWVYGYLADENYINSPELEGEFLVDKDTVGQYIDVKDKNGKEVYEGDIVRKIESYAILWKSAYSFYLIEWNDKICAFVATNTVSNETFLLYELGEIEVFGNVYENADLVKEVD